MAYLWRWRPMWSDPVRERLEWLTTVSQARDGTEQRQSVRATPRRSVEWSVTNYDVQFRRILGRLFTQQSGEWAVPLWWTGQILGAEVTQGATSIPCDILGRELLDGGTAALISPSGATDQLAIDTVEEAGINLSAPVSATFPAGTYLYATRLGVMSPECELSRVVPHVGQGAVKFDLQPPQLHGVDTPNLYLGDPLLEIPTRWHDALEMGFARRIDRVDYATGAIWQYDPSDKSWLRSQHNWMARNLTEAETIRRWWYGRRGRWQSFWCPSNTSDLQIAANVANGATSIDVEPVLYATRYLSQHQRQDISIRLKNGTVYNRRVSGCSTVSGVERLSLTSSIPTGFTVADVVRISFLERVRSESDSLELSWILPTVCEASSYFVGVDA